MPQALPTRQLQFGAAKSGRRIILRCIQACFRQESCIQYGSMKPEVAILSVLLAFSGPGPLFGQGTLQWGNRYGTTSSGLRAPIYGADPQDPFTQRTGNTPNGIPAGTQTYGGPLLEGTGFTAALYVGTTPEAVRGNLSALDTTGFRTGSAAGLVIGPRIVIVPGTEGGGQVYVQLRAWG